MQAEAMPGGCPARRKGYIKYGIASSKYRVTKTLQFLSGIVIPCVAQAARR
jgi:hypothetical protein